MLKSNSRVSRPKSIIKDYGKEGQSIGGNEGQTDQGAT